MINLSKFQSFSANPVQENQQKKESINLSNPGEKNNNNPKLVSPGVEHLKANYLSFSSNTGPLAENLVERTPTETAPFLADLCSEETLTDAVKFKPYEKISELIAFNIFNGSNTMITHENGAMQELAANSFTEALIKGKFANLGITKENTDVYFFDAGLASEGTDPKEAQENVQNNIKICTDKAAKSNKQVIFFVSDPTKVNLMFDSPMIKTVSFVELQPEGEDEKGQPIDPMPKKAGEILAGDPSVNLLDLPIAGAPETKSFLKTYKDIFITPLLPEGMKISDKAVDKAVDLTKRAEGVYPGKAVNFIADTLPALLMNSTSSTISTKNIETATRKYPEIFGEEPKTMPKLKDVGGIENCEQFIREEILNKIGKNNSKDAPPNSVLITGENGSGKTLLANAIAGEANSPVVTVSALQLCEILDNDKMTGHPSLEPIYAAFDSAKAAALDSDNKTAFLYIKGFDSLVNKHSKTEGLLEEKNTKDLYLTEVLKEIQSINNKNSDINVVVLASIEVPELVDSEFKKTDTFGTRISVPDNAGSEKVRLSSLKLLSKDIKFENDESKEKILAEAAKITDGANAAELRTIMNKANAIVDARQENKHLTINDVYESLIQTDMGPITQSESPDWFKKLVIKHETGHAVVAQTLFNMAKEDWQKPNEIHLVTFDPRGDAGGFVSFGPGKNGMLSYNSLISELAVSYGGLQVEKHMFKGDFTSGPSSDLEQATHLAEAGVGLIGKGKNTGLVADPKLMAEENKKDIILLTKVSSKISELIVAFHKDFVDEYGDKCFNHLGKGGNTMSAESFKNSLNEWLDKDDRREKLKFLEAKIEVLTDTARKKGEFIESPLELRQLANAKLRTVEYNKNNK